MSIFLWLLLVIAAIVWMTVRLKLHPFLALLFGAIAMGVLARLEPEVLVGSIADGFGSTLRSIGIVIAAGAIIGEYLDRSGGAKVLAGKILDRVGKRNSPLSMSLTGYIVSIPVFCDSGFIVLSALNKAIGKQTRISLAVLAVALASGLYATHVFVPPTPGPLAAAATLGADIGWVIILGLIVSLPVMIVALLWESKFCRNYDIQYELSEQKEPAVAHPPSFTLAIIPILIPILLIACKSLAEFPAAPFGDGFLYNASVFMGNPIIALLCGVLLAFLMVKSGGEEGGHDHPDHRLGGRLWCGPEGDGIGGFCGAICRRRGIGSLDPLSHCGIPENRSGLFHSGHYYRIGHLCPIARAPRA